MDPRPYNYEYRKPRFSNPTFKSGSLYDSMYHVGSYQRANPNIDKINNHVPPQYAPSPARERANEMINQRVRQIDPYAYDISKPARSQEEYVRREPERQPPSIERGEARQPPKQNYQPAQRENPNNYERGRDNYEQPRNSPYDDVRKGGYESNRNGYERPNDRDNNQSNRRNYEQPEVRKEQPKNFQPEDRPKFHQRSYSQDSPTSAHKSKNNEQGYMSNYGTRLMRPMPGRDQDTVYERQQKPYNIISCYPKEVPNVHRQFPRLTLENKLIENGQYGYLPEGYRL